MKQISILLWHKLFIEKPEFTQKLAISPAASLSANSPL